MQDYKKHNLSSGMDLITVPQKGTKAAVVLVLVKTGSKYEEKEIMGISHFLEHMLFKKTEKRPSPLDIAETLDKVGGSYNAFTSEDFTGYYAKVNSEKLDLALDWVSDIYLNSLLPAQEVEKEKGVIAEEINMRYDNPMTYSQVLWQRLLYGDQPAGWDVSGSKESVAGITREDLLDYMNTQYTAKNTLVVLAGNINHKEGKKKIEDYFSEIRDEKPKRKQEVFENQKEPEVKILKRETDQTHMCLGVRGFRDARPERYTQEIIATILGGMMSSRLFSKVREELGLAYYIQAASSSNPDTGYLVTRAGLDNSNAEIGIKAILKEFKRLKEEKVSDEELKKAKDYIKGKTSLKLESSDSLAFYYGRQALLERNILTPMELFKRIDSVDADDILRVSKKIFVPERLNLSLIGPFEDKEDFREILKKNF
ncbi:MAG: M16 family metallopeptidase [Patescibacteria group bacterium]